MKTFGKVFLDRKMLGWQWHANPMMMSIWAHLLMLAEYEDVEYNGVLVHRGECLLSVVWLAELVGLSVKTLRLCLKRLEETGYIARKRKANRTLITILGYGEPQQWDTAEGKQVPDEKGSSYPAEGEPGTSIEINNNKKQKNDDAGTSGTIPAAQGTTAGTDTPIQGVDERMAAADERMAAADERMAAAVGESLAEQSAARRKEYGCRVAEDGYWRGRCCEDYGYEVREYRRCVVAFCEYKRRNEPTKLWLSYGDFCRNMHSWLRFKRREDIVRLSNMALQRYRARRDYEARMDALYASS